MGTVTCDVMKDEYLLITLCAEPRGLDFKTHKQKDGFFVSLSKCH